MFRIGYGSHAIVSKGLGCLHGSLCRLYIRLHETFDYTSVSTRTSCKHFFVSTDSIPHRYPHWQPVRTCLRYGQILSRSCLGFALRVTKSHNDIRSSSQTRHPRTPGISKDSCLWESALKSSHGHILIFTQKFGFAFDHNVT